MIDLRSDTATKPTAGMYEAMVSAPVGDDMLGEDPTVNHLEKMVREMCDKPAAVFACSGSQSNQMAIFAHCQPGQELLLEATGHIANYEAGAPAVLSGVSCRTLQGEQGMLDVENLEGEVHAGDLHLSPTGLLCLENTTNMGGGKAYPLEQMDRIGEWAAKKKIPVHLDGARLFNATVARGYSPARLLRHISSVSICFSKGLGCPMGSILVGEEDVICKAKRARKIFGGSLRQAGVIAACAVYGLENHIDLLKVDHENAQFFAKELAKIEGIVLNPDAVETNLVFWELEKRYGSAARLEKRLLERGVGVFAVGKQRLRACTHYDISTEQIHEAVQAIRDLLVPMSEKES